MQVSAVAMSMCWMIWWTSCTSPFWMLLGAASPAASCQTCGRGPAAAQHTLLSPVCNHAHPSTSQASEPQASAAPVQPAVEIHDTAGDGSTTAVILSISPPQALSCYFQTPAQAAAKTNDTAGDGTTTATILSAAIIAEGMKIVAAGANPVQVRRRCCGQAVPVCCRAVAHADTHHQHLCSDCWHI
jgi:hypothetical protein